LKRQFNGVIYLFKEFKIFWSKMTCLDEEIQKKLKLKNFKKVFQITKIVEFEINKKIKISLLFTPLTNVNSS